MDQRRPRRQRARHRHEALGLGIDQVLPGLRLDGRIDVVDDARGDQLGREVVAVGVVESRVIGCDRRVRMGHQPALLLQPFHRHRVGDQQQIGLRVAGGDLGPQLRHYLGRAVADPLDVDVRVERLERVDRLLGVLVRLAGVEHQLARRRQRRPGEQRNGRNRRHGYAELSHPSLPVFSERGQRGFPPLPAPFKAPP